MPTNEEMIAWLEEKIARDTEWLKHIEILEALDIVHLISEFVDETSPSYSETKYNIGIYQAILAELELKMTEWTPDRPCPKEGAALSGPSEEEGKEMFSAIKGWYGHYVTCEDTYSDNIYCEKMFNKIALILGKEMAGPMNQKSRPRREGKMKKANQAIISLDYYDGIWSWTLWAGEETVAMSAINFKDGTEAKKAAVRAKKLMAEAKIEGGEDETKD